MKQSTLLYLLAGGAALYWLSRRKGGMFGLGDADPCSVASCQAAGGVKMSQPYASIGDMKWVCIDSHGNFVSGHCAGAWASPLPVPTPKPAPAPVPPAEIVPMPQTPPAEIVPVPPMAPGYTLPSDADLAAEVLKEQQEIVESIKPSWKVYPGNDAAAVAQLQSSFEAFSAAHPSTPYVLPPYDPNRPAPDWMQPLCDAYNRALSERASQMIQDYVANSLMPSLKATASDFGNAAVETANDFLATAVDYQKNIADGLGQLAQATNDPRAIPIMQGTLGVTGPDQALAFWQSGGGRSLRTGKMFGMISDPNIQKGISAVNAVIGDITPTSADWSPSAQQVASAKQQLFEITQEMFPPAQIKAGLIASSLVSPNTLLSLKNSITNNLIPGTYGLGTMLKNSTASAPSSAPLRGLFGLGRVAVKRSTGRTTAARGAGRKRAVPQLDAVVRELNKQVRVWREVIKAVAYGQKHPLKVKPVAPHHVAKPKKKLRGLMALESSICGMGDYL